MERGGTGEEGGEIEEKERADERGDDCGDSREYSIGGSPGLIILELQ